MTYEKDVFVEILVDFKMGSGDDYYIGEYRWFGATLANSLVEEGVARYLTDDEIQEFENRIK